LRSVVIFFLGVVIVLIEVIFFIDILFLLYKYTVRLTLYLMESKVHTDEEEASDSASKKRKLGDIVRETCLELETEMKSLDAKRAELDTVMEKVNDHAAAAPRKIKLDIGGDKFTTTKDTLNKFKNSFFYTIDWVGELEPGRRWVLLRGQRPDLLPPRDGVHEVWQHIFPGAGGRGSGKGQRRL
jgi:hypothetical protein